MLPSDIRRVNDFIEILDELSEKVLPPVFVVGLAILIYALIQESRPNPDKALAYGCYAADKAPAIRLSDAGMRIMQERFPTIGFHLERGKYGMLLAAEQPIAARRTEEGYEYWIKRRGTGRFLPFFESAANSGYRRWGRVNGPNDENQLSGFIMLAGDGTDIRYDPAPLSACEADQEASS